MASPSPVFEPGKHTVKLVRVDPRSMKPSDDDVVLPPKPLLIATPCERGEFPTLLLLHGYLLYNSFYSQLIQHIASHGFIVVVPQQLYSLAGPDTTEDINSAATTANWLIDGLKGFLPENVLPNLDELGLSGHSRGGKAAFALALGHAKTKLKLKFSALIGVDPVGGLSKCCQTYPPILTGIPHSLEVKMATLVIGAELSEEKKNLLLPPCAPKGLNHQDFYDECCAPACHFVAKDYGHLDVLDDDTEGLRGKATYCFCTNGESRKPMRMFVGGIMVAFMKAYFQGYTEDLTSIIDNPVTANVELSMVSFTGQRPVKTLMGTFQRVWCRTDPYTAIGCLKSSLCMVM